MAVTMVLLVLVLLWILSRCCRVLVNLARELHQIQARQRQQLDSLARQMESQLEVSDLDRSSLRPTDHRQHMADNRQPPVRFGNN